jgi:sarcosine oxidase, subunit gamma
VPEHRLKPITPLGKDAPQTFTVGPVTIRENTDNALASLATRSGRGGDVATAAETAGIPLPGPGKTASSATYSALWLGPDQWMIEAPIGTHEDIVAVLRPLFGDAASLTEQTDAWVRFDVTGPDLPSLFERICAFDLRTHAPGSATRTVIEHLGCYVALRASNEVSVLGPRSSAHSLHHALLTAARSVY